ncbi:hypothetical protein EDD11_001907 [Mortierella claussenii]|nr:hypothetical protein EDD11_001907 [Mortierella claussenii]
MTPAISINSNGSGNGPSSYFAPQHSSGTPYYSAGPASTPTPASTISHNVAPSPVAGSRSSNHSSTNGSSTNGYHQKDPSGSFGATNTNGYQSSTSGGGGPPNSGTAAQRNIVGVLLPNGGGPDPDSAPQESMFLCLQDLFQRIQNHSKKTQFFTPTAFVAKVKKENELFRSSMHQDAHEFLMFIMSAISEDIEADLKKSQKELEDSLPKTPAIMNGTSNGLGSSKASMDEVSMTLSGGDEVRIKVNGADINTATATNSISGSSTHGPGQHSGGRESSIGDRSSIQSESTIPKPKEKMWVQKLFEGQLTNEIKCLTCEKTTNRAESFMDLSLDIEQNSSVTSCLRQFSASEMLCHKDKFYCDECCGLQEAEKRMKIQVLPNILSLHLKRFKYQEALQKYVKLSYRVSFPMELRLFNTVDDMEDPDRIYDLNAFVVHVGSGPHHGHYVAVVKHQDRWLLFDDETVETIDESDIHKYFGDSAQLGSGYVLFYQARDLDMSTIVPMQWAQHQMQQHHYQLQQLQPSFTLKGPIHVIPPSTFPVNGLGPADLDQFGGLLPHTQQQELIHQQLASRQQQQQQQQNGSSGFGSLFGGGAPSPITATHLSNGPLSPVGPPRSPTQIQDPTTLLNGQKITSGSYVYTNGAAAVAAAAAVSGSVPSSSGSTTGSSLGHYAFSTTMTNGYQYSNETTPDYGHLPSSPSAYSSFTNGHSGGGVPPSPTQSTSFVSLHFSSSSGSGSTTTTSGLGTTIVPHTTIDPAKLKRAQSTPRISLASAAKTFGASGGKSFIGSLRGNSGGGS